MGTRSNDPEAPRGPLLSSLIVRASDSAKGVGTEGDDVGTSYKSGEVHRHQHGYSSDDRIDFRGRRLQASPLSPTHHRNAINRVSPGPESTVSAPRNRGFNYARDSGHHRFGNGRDSGRRLQAGTFSPVHRRDAINRVSSGPERIIGAQRNHGFDNVRDSAHHRFGNGRDSGRYREFSPSYSQGRDFRFDSRSYDPSARVPIPVRGEGHSRNNPNVRQRQGDWICKDPLCNYLNTARRERCNNCNWPRNESSTSPRRGGYPGNPYVQRQQPSPLMDSSPRRMVSDGYRSPPRSWQRDIIARDFRPTGQLNRYEGRVADPPLRVNRRLHCGTDPRDRLGFDRPLPGDWTRLSDNYLDDRRGHDRLVSPSSAVASHDWQSYNRNRSRSPMRGDEHPPMKYRLEVYIDQQQGNRRVVKRDVV